SQARNNHVSWYIAQLVSFTLFSGDVDSARSLLDPAKDYLKQQFSSDGSMPREMVRANSAMYSVYGLRSFIVLARLAEVLGESLWEMEVEGEPILRRALYFLAPYYSGKADWEFGTVHKDVDPYTFQVFRLGA